MRYGKQSFFTKHISVNDTFSNNIFQINRMIEKKSDKAKQDQKPRDDGVELENQFILRLPEEPAKALRETLQSPNSNLKDRMSIQLDNDLRYGEVRFDQWLLHAKVVDLPTIIECLKSIDNKSFYKSADICQMMICKEEQHDLDKDESPSKGKKKDPNKVDKKFLWAHGITPPCKNVRKRRFRKTLKKKNVEAPEIEKEVKRLLRIDNDAVKVDFEIINEDVDKQSLEEQSKEYNEAEEEFPDEAMREREKAINENSIQTRHNAESDGDEEEPGTGSAAIGGVGEHDIFGEEVSSSDDEDDNRRHNTAGLCELDETSRLSAEDSRLSDYSTGKADGGGPGSSNTNTNMIDNIMHSDVVCKEDNANVNDFSKALFNIPKSNTNDDTKIDNTSVSFFDENKRIDSDDEYSNENSQVRFEQIQLKITELQRQYEEIKIQHIQKAQEISSIQNPTLRQRMQETLDNLANKMSQKELEIKDYENMF